METQLEPAPKRRLEWGLAPPEDATCAWGARAIYNLSYEVNSARKKAKRPTKHWVAYVDLLPDRQDGFGVEAERKALGEWLNKIALPALRKKLATDCIQGDSEEIVTIALSGYQLIASPRRSYGYLYLAAWKTP